MKELVEFIARALVRHPDAVRVGETQGESTSIVELTVAADDLGRVIGKEGRTVKALRIIVSAAAARADRKVVLEIRDEK